MKVVGTLQCTAALRASPEDIAPPGGIVWSAVIAAISSAYKFSSVPIAHPGVAVSLEAQLVFQNGEFEAGGTKIAIQSMYLSGRGAAIQTTTTEHSDLVLDDLIRILDEKLEFRIRNSRHKRDRVSNVVVEFEQSIEQQRPMLRQVIALLEEVMGPGPLAVKRLAFGREAKAAPTIDQMTGLDAVDYLDFVLERRAGQPFAEHRYFSSAPIASQRHIELLKAIEQILSRD